jgi:effector-binding domain-containing protein
MPRFQVYRSIQISAQPEEVFDRVADFGTWTTWSPWLLAEPTAEVTVTDNASEVGAIYAWTGTVVGAGEVEHQDLDRPHRIDDEIRFLKPFPSKSKVTFELERCAGGTKLKWGMEGSLPWFMFAMRPMMETFIGMDYERGLKMLKEWIETGSIQSRTQVKGVVPIGKLTMLGVRDQCRVSDVSASMEAAFKQATALFEQHDLPTGGGTIAVYTGFDMKAGVFDYLAGYVVPDATQCQASELTPWSFPAGKAFMVEHIGSYRHLGNAWSAANQIVRYQKMKQSKLGTFELLKTTPSQVPEAELRTEIYLPLR